VQDGAFANGLAAWQAKGSVSARTIKGWGRKALTARHSPQLCDTVCVFRREAKGRNELSQTLKNLTPGKLYSLRYAIGSVAAFEGKGKVESPKSLAFSAKLDDVSVIDEGLPLHKYDDAESSSSFASYRTIVFRAKGETAKVVFSDGAVSSGAPAGEELALGAISVAPYYLP